MKNLGMKVKIKYTSKSAYFRNRIKTEIFRNITEIHYCYKSPLGKQTAFESDIHGTGCTRFNDEIKEFEAVLEKDKAKNFNMIKKKKLTHAYQNILENLPKNINRDDAERMGRILGMRATLRILYDEMAYSPEFIEYIIEEFIKNKRWKEFINK